MNKLITSEKEQIVIHTNELLSNHTINRGVERLLENDKALAPEIHKVTANSTDNNPGYLYTGNPETSKIYPLGTVTFTKENPGVNEIIVIGLPNAGFDALSGLFPINNDTIANNLVAYASTDALFIKDSGISSEGIKNSINALVTVAETSAAWTTIANSNCKFVSAMTYDDIYGGDSWAKTTLTWTNAGNYTYETVTDICLSGFAGTGLVSGSIYRMFLEINTNCNIVNGFVTIVITYPGAANEASTFRADYTPYYRHRRSTIYYAVNNVNSNMIQMTHSDGYQHGFLGYLVSLPVNTQVAEKIIIRQYSQSATTQGVGTGVLHSTIKILGFQQV